MWPSAATSSASGIRSARRSAKPREIRAPARPCPADPVLLHPKSMRGLFGRQVELAAALSGLDRRLTVEVTGEAGVGKTAFLRQLAHHPRAASFKDGVVYLTARHQSPADVLQLIFDAFYDSEQTCKPTEADIRRTLRTNRLSSCSTMSRWRSTTSNTFWTSRRSRPSSSRRGCGACGARCARCRSTACRQSTRCSCSSATWSARWPRRSDRRRTRSARSSVATLSESCRPRHSSATIQTRSTSGPAGSRQQRSSGS